MERTRRRGWLVVGALLTAIGVASCSQDSPTSPRMLLHDPSRAVSWDADPDLCRIGKFNLDPGGSQTWFWTTVPTVDTACGVIVSMSIPPIIDLVRYPNERSFGWVRLEPGAPKTSGYQIGFYNDHVNGPITYTFSQPINKFSMKVEGAAPIAPSHYMLAFDAVSGGNLIDSVSFGPGVGSPAAVDVQSLNAFGIRRVEVHMLLLGPEPTGDYRIAYPLYRWAALSQDTTKPPCPPTGDPVFDSTIVRDTIIGIYNAMAQDSTELIALVYKNPFRIETPSQTRTFCGSTITGWPTPLAHMDSNLVAMIHPHLNSAGVLNPCDNLPYDVVPLNGLSGRDGVSWLAGSVGRIFGGLPEYGMYVIDNERIWLNPPGNYGVYFGRNRSVPRTPPNCKWR